MRPAAVVIVGMGQGGFQVAASLREEGFDGRVILVGDEPDLPYQRPPLSKAYLTGKADKGAVRLRPDRFFAEHRLELRAGERATGIDRPGRRVTLASGEALPYDHLVLAMGARNRLLPVFGAEFDGVLQLRTLDDAEVLRQRLEVAREVVVVGAGFIGLEFAAVAASRGASVTVVEALGRPMARAVSPEVSSHFRAMHEGRGVHFVFGAAVARVLGEGGRATGVETADGRRFLADLVFVGIGVVPNAEIAAEAGLAVSNGVVVDEHLVTSDPAISAIGDCALHPSPFAAAGPVRLESVQGAVDQARCVAARLAGRPAPYASLPWFWSEQGLLKLQIAGLAVPCERTVVRGDLHGDPTPGTKGGFSVFCFRGTKLVGVESVNRPLDHILARKLLARGGADLTPEQAGDPCFDLKDHANAPQPSAVAAAVAAAVRGV